jgi:hypothetical protein
MGELKALKATQHRSSRRRGRREENGGDAETD